MGFSRSFRVDKETFEIPGPLEINVAGADALFLGIDLVFYWFFVYMAENNFFLNRPQRDHDDNWQNPSPDDDVVEEEKRVAMSNPNTDFQVRCENLRKVYWEENNPKVAVRNISFGLDFGDCFALLGVNGAGKTTTFKSLTRDVTPTKGTIHIAGMNI